MASSGRDFTLPDFFATFGSVVMPAADRPLVVHDDQLHLLPAGSVPNPTQLRVAGTLPTRTFELFRQVIGAGESSDMQRHYHETVHFVLSGSGWSEIQAGAGEHADLYETVTWTSGSFIYTPPWTWHRHYNDSDEADVEFLTIENSRLLAPLGLVRRQSAGMSTFAQARARFDAHPTDEEPS